LHKVHPSIVVAAKGKSINKAITVVEIIKRRLAGTLHQYNQVGKVTSTEQWDPVKDSELDS
jgi:DNA-binding protein